MQYLVCGPQAQFGHNYYCLPKSKDKQESLRNNQGELGRDSNKEQMLLLLFLLKLVTVLLIYL